MTEQAIIAAARRRFHQDLLDSILTFDGKGIPTISDSSNAASRRIAEGLIKALGTPGVRKRVAGQKSGNVFERFCAAFLTATFPRLSHLRPGKWGIELVSGGARMHIAKFEQYAHLVALEEAAKSNRELAVALGSDYTITPDIVIHRTPEDDEAINAPAFIVDETTALRTGIRKRNNARHLLHASISCKWTMRSDRAQNSRSEALNLVRNRKGGLPHIAVVTAEPLPSRIASLAMGTGDIDCVYHFALDELVQSVASAELHDALELLHMMIDGKRLRDISDLPLDLTI